MFWFIVFERIDDVAVISCSRHVKNLIVSKVQNGEMSERCREETFLLDLQIQKK